jgi:phosphate transport system permease protein
MSQPTPARGHSGEPINPPLSALVGRAARWALVAGLAGGAVYGLGAFISTASAGPGLDVVTISRRAGVAAVVVFALAWPLRLLYLSRPLLDRSFAVLGILATCFGLAMLCVFFARLGMDAAEWFEIMPGLIEQRNEELREQHKALIVNGLKGLDKELQSALKREDAAAAQAVKAAGTEEEKAKLREASVKKKEALRERYKTQIIPAKMAEWGVTLKQMENEAKGIRTDTSPGALLAHFLTQYPDAQPQDAGIYPALLGSLWLGLITIVVAVPIGVGAALYLEEYKGRGWLGHVIQVNINNLAGVPSVVYGILGAFVFVGLIFRPLEHVHPQIAARNLLGGGLTLALLTLPVVIVAAQEAIRAVPVSIRHGAYALGATQWQVIWHQVLPMARPGILTGTILSLSRAIGEAAPLVLFGALTYVSQDPTLLGRFTALPLQIFGWADRPATVTATAGSGEAWRYNAALASIVLLLLLLTLNGFAIYFRNRAQRQMRY